MRFRLPLPATLQNVRNMPWSTSVAAEDFQRLDLRVITAMLLVTLLSSGLVLLGILLDIFAGPTGKVGMYGVLGALLAVVLAIYPLAVLFIMSVKLNVFRARALGLPPRAAIFGVVGFMAAGMLGMMLLMLFAFSGQDLSSDAPLTMPWWFSYGMLAILAPHALFQYFMYFEETPIRRTKTKPHSFFSGLPRAEGALLFLYQTYLWYTILRTPLDVMFPEF